jgi:serine protease Do
MNTRTCCLVGCLLAPLAAPAPGWAQAASRQARASALQQFSDDLEALARDVHPAVVQILATGLAPAPSAGGPSSALLQVQRSGGSGVIVDAGGFVLTNAHVVDGARTLRVTLASPPAAPGASIVRPAGPSYEAQVVGLDRETDLAVLRIEATGLHALPLADSDALRPGQVVLAFGSPLTLDSSVTMGVVSAVGRQRQPEDPVVYIQTDAPLNPGSSGGPLVDTGGRLVGINTFILSQSGGSEGIGFAIPSNIVRSVFEQIRATGRVRRGTLGVYAQTVTPAITAGLGLPVGRGAILGDVYPGGPGEDAGLQPGDVVLALDGKPIENGRQLDVNVYRRRIGDTVTLEVLRDGERRRIVSRVGEAEDEAARFGDLVDPARNLVPRLGILALDITGDVAAMMPVMRLPAGVLVAARAADAPATAGQALAPLDVITAVNGVLIAGVDDLREELAKIPAGGACVLHVQRGPALRFVALDLD